MRGYTGTKGIGLTVPTRKWTFWPQNGLWSSCSLFRSLR